MFMQLAENQIDTNFATLVITYSSQQLLVPFWFWCHQQLSLLGVSSLSDPRDACTTSFSSYRGDICIAAACEIDHCYG